MESPDRILLRSSPVEDTTPEMGLVLGHALAMDYKTVVISRDLMRSSTMMKEALVAGLTASGADVIDLGCTSAPVAAMMAKMGDCAVYITEYREYGLVSGYILLNSNGSLFRKDQIRHLDKIFTEKPELPDYRHLGTVRCYNYATEEYNHKLLSVLTAEAGCSMILDCNCGVAADSAPQILNAINADVISINAQRDRNFITRSLSPTETELRDIRQFIEKDLGTIGIALNRIGTLATVLDESGHIIDNDVVLALMMIFLKPTKVVVPEDISSLVEDAFYGRIETEMVTPFERAEDAEIQFIRTLPDAGAICDAVANTNADIGYYDGGFIFKDLSMMNDGIYAAAVVAQMASKNSLKQIIDALPEYYSDCKTYHYECTAEEFSRVMDEAVNNLKGATVECNRGWRVQMDGGWFIIYFDKEQENTVYVKCESNDKAYLIGLIEISGDLVESCSMGQ